MREHLKHSKLNSKNKKKGMGDLKIRKLSGKGIIGVYTI